MNQEYTTFSTHHVVIHGRDACTTFELPRNYAVIMNCDSSKCTHYIGPHRLHTKLLAENDLRAEGALMRYAAAVNKHLNCDRERNICQNFCIFYGTCPELILSSPIDESKMYKEQFGFGAMYHISHPHLNGQATMTPLVRGLDIKLSETIEKLPPSMYSRFNLIIVPACRSVCTPALGLQSHPIKDYVNWIDFIFRPAGLVSNNVPDSDPGGTELRFVIPEILDVYYTGDVDSTQRQVTDDAKNALEEWVKSAIRSATGNGDDKNNTLNTLIRSSIESRHGNEVRVDAIYVRTGRICIVIGITPVCIPVDPAALGRLFLSVAFAPNCKINSNGSFSISEVDESTKSKLVELIKLALQSKSSVGIPKFTVYDITVQTGTIIIAQPGAVIPLAVDQAALKELFARKGHLPPTPLPRQESVRRPASSTASSVRIMYLPNVPPSPPRARPAIFITPCMLVLRERSSATQDMHEPDKVKLKGLIHAADAQLDPILSFFVGSVKPDAGLVTVGHWRGKQYITSTEVKVDQAALEQLFPAAAKRGAQRRTRKARRPSRKQAYASTGRRDTATGRMLYSRAGASALFVRRRKPDGTYRYMRCTPT